MVRFILTLLVQTIGHSYLAACKRYDAVKGMNETEKQMKHCVETSRASGCNNQKKSRCVP